jgi:hypothetical protein
MTSWFRLTLCFLALQCLLLHLTQPADLNHQLQIVGWGSWFDRGREPAPDVLTVSAVRSMEFRARAGPRQSLVLNSALTAGNSGPSGWESHGPSAPIGPWRVAGQAVKPATPTNARRAHFSAKILDQTTNFKTSGFRNTL